MRIESHEEAFDYADALYQWLSEWHEGQDSEKYAMLSALQSEYRYSPGMGGPELADNLIYADLDEGNYTDYWREFCRYMDDEWGNQE